MTQESNAPSVSRKPITRHTTKKPAQQPATQQQPAAQQSAANATTAWPIGQGYIPHPADVQPTSDYWIREGHLWKRVHIQPRTTLYVPERTTDGPNVDNLLPARRTRIIPTKQDQTGPTVHEDNWQAAGNQQTNTEWTDSTNFEEKVEYKEQLDSDDDEQQEAQRAQRSQGT